MIKAKLIEVSHPNHSENLAEILLGGGIVGAIWSHHLYFLACNGYNLQAVKRMNEIKGRPKDQVFASPGAVEEAEEFADLKKSKALSWAASKMKMSPLEYLELLYRKFPLAVEFYSNHLAPSTVTFATKSGKTIWIAGHIADRSYSQFLDAVRRLRRSGKKIIFAGTSLNLRGDNTLTVKQFDKVVEDFGDKVDALAVYPRASSLKKLRYSTSCSVVSFIGNKPKLMRLGCSSIATLQKYIPGLQISKKLRSTRK